MYNTFFLYVARGISTVIGTLLFLIVASLLLALALRAFSETVLAYREVSNNQRLFLEQLEIGINYTQWKKVLARDVISALQVIEGTSTNVDPRLLDYQDGNSIIIESVGGTIVSSSIYASGATNLIRNGEFDDGLQYWTTGGVTGCSWRDVIVGGDRKAQCTCSVTGTGSGQAYIFQSFTLGFTPESSILSFEYEASFSTRDSLVYLLIVQVRRDRDAVWFWVVDFHATGGAKRTVSLNLASVLREPGTYALNFTLVMAWRGATTYTFTLDKVSLVVSAQPPQPPPQPPQQPFPAYNLVILNIGTVSTQPTFRGRLSISSNLSREDFLYIELYRWSSNGASLVEKSVIRGGEMFYLEGFEGKGGTEFLVVTSSLKPFKLILDHFDVSLLILSSAKVKVTNMGNHPVEVIAVWLRSSTWDRRVDVKRHLLPSESIVLDFGTNLEWNKNYEVRVVTATRVHTAKFTTSGG